MHKCLFHFGFQENLISSLNKDEDRKYNPVVNVKFISGASKPNNTALFFNGKSHRYYLHVDPKDELMLEPVKLPVEHDDWRNHLQFTNH